MTWGSHGKSGRQVTYAEWLPHATPCVWNCHSSSASAGFCFPFLTKGETGSRDMVTLAQGPRASKRSSWPVSSDCPLPRPRLLPLQPASCNMAPVHPGPAFKCVAGTVRPGAGPFNEIFPDQPLEVALFAQHLLCVCQHKYMQNHLMYQHSRVICAEHSQHTVGGQRMFAPSSNLNSVSVESAFFLLLPWRPPHTCAHAHTCIHTQ